MSVKINNVTVTGLNSVLIEYESTESSPTYYIYLDGNLIDITESAEYELGVNINENYILEILDSADESPMQVFPGKIRLNWFASDDVKYYFVDEYINESWKTRKRLNDNGGYMEFESRFLEDSQNHTFRITPVGINGNEGQAKQFTTLCVRHPDVPDVSYSYDDETAKITISES